MSSSPPSSSLSSRAALGNSSPRSRSRWFLTFQAYLWRLLARIGFYLHPFPKPSPPEPSFISSYSTAPLHGPGAAILQLAFYVPAEYHREVERGRKYPAVVNFHGGGFTLGRPSDDARWAAAVNRQASAIVVGVTYRLAPEHPFPTAVEDGMCALLHIAAHAERLGIDPSQLSLSGFSAGANLAFAIPLRLQSYIRSSGMHPHENESSAPDLPRVASIIAWYPGLDYRLSRDQRRAASVKPSKTLSPILTNLMDASYFPDAADMKSPYASPAAATDEELVTALPDDIALFLCEWDMLLQEGTDFSERLESLGKRVRCEIIKEREHAFDKKPWPFKLDWKVGFYYQLACEWICEVHRGSAHRARSRQTEQLE
ncbi:MAG: hypothetical protein L6R36_007646 [Xanthoria steineri]|nr:MAG: hypothetical protein L6R36_007646 [Xanthoria steineri]